MTVDFLLRFLAWATLINYAVLCAWFLLFIMAHGWIYKLHSRWFRLSEQAFNTVHYAGMGLYKLLIFVFLLVPYVVLRFVL